MTAPTDHVALLVDCLQTLPPGDVEDLKSISRLLENAWEHLCGSDETSMRARKLWRIETAQWSPPNLDFTIERHGQTVNGSSRATVQTWRVDTITASASVVNETRRQLYQAERPLDVGPLAEELVSAIVNGDTSHQWLKWRSATCVALKISDVIPTTNAQTTAARRNRLRKLVDAKLKPHGFVALRTNVYEKLPR